MRVSFGDFVLDRGTRQLLCGASPRHLGPPPLMVTTVQERIATR